MGCLVGTAYQTLLGRLAGTLEKAGIKITTAEYMILRVLYTEDGQQQCDIASILGKDRSTVCRTLSGMEKKGLLAIEVVSHKCRRAFLTPAGEALREPIMEVARERERDLARVLGGENLPEFEMALRKIICDSE